MVITSNEIREYHKTGIGASMSAKILGVSPFGGPMDVFNDMMGLSDDIGSEAMEWGNYLEEPVAQKFASNNGVKLRRVNKPARHKKHEWFMCLPDRLIIGKKEGVEIKTTSAWLKDGWGEEGTDQIPEAYIVQCQKCMHIYDYPIWHLPVLIGGNQYKEYIVEADKELQQMIFESDHDFYHNHFLKKVPPPIDGSDASKTYLQKMFPRNVEDIREATIDERVHLVLMETAKQMKKRAEEKISELQNIIQASIGEHEGIQIDRYKATWKNAKCSTKTDFKSLCAALSKMVPDDIYEEILAEHTTIKPGARRFLLQVKEVSK